MLKVCRHACSPSQVQQQDAYRPRAHNRQPKRWWAGTFMADNLQLNPKHHLNLSNGRFNGTSREQLSALFQNLPGDAHQDHLLVHFHGGLNNRQVGLKAAKFLGENCYNSRSYPVFFIWESGLIEILKNNLPEIVSEVSFQRLLELVSRFAIAKAEKGAGNRGGRLELPPESQVKARLAQSKARVEGEESAEGEAPVENEAEPFVEINVQLLPPEEHLEEQEARQFEEALRADTILQQEEQKIANSLLSREEMAAQSRGTRGARVQGSTQTLMSPAVVEEIQRESPVDGERGLFATGRLIAGGLRILERVVLRFARNRAHGLYPTVVEEILRELYLANVGEKVWELMKKDTADAFGDDARVCGGTAFLEELSARLTTAPNTRLTLVGHSTGAHYICHFLRHAHARLPANVKFNVVLLAPACDFALMQETIENYGARINGIRIFAMSDDLEKQDALLDSFPRAYPRSLLYFVSGILENEADKPLVGMQKFYGGGAAYSASAYPEIAAVNRYLSSKTNGFVWSSSNNGQGLSSASTDHGDFDNDSETLQSLGHILDNGF